MVLLPECDPRPLVCFSMDNALNASMDIVDCNMPCVCENASISIYPHDCDDVLHESMGVVEIPNIKLLKKEGMKFHKNLSKFCCEKFDLIVKLNESKKLVESIRSLLKILMKS